VRPRDLGEHVVARAWSEALGRPSIDVRESLDALGADEAAAGWAAERIRAALALPNAVPRRPGAACVEQIAAALRLRERR
jgi:hypothetical protein